MIPPAVVIPDESANLTLQLLRRLKHQQIHLLLAASVIPLNLAVRLRMIRTRQNMADPPDLQILAKIRPPEDQPTEKQVEEMLLRMKRRWGLA